MRPVLRPLAQPEISGDCYLELVKISPAGQSLGLRHGDKLVGLNGEPFTEGARVMASRFSPREDKRITMHFERADVNLTVLSVTAKLGRWRPCPIAGASRVKSVNAKKVHNWEILRSQDGVYDLFRHRVSAISWMMPLLWMAHMRLWPHMAGFIALVALGWPAGIWAMVLLWFLGGAFVWRGYAQLIRSDRQSRGMIPFAVVAAESEMAAHAAYLAMQPDDRFAFGTIILPTPVKSKKRSNEASA